MGTRSGVVLTFRGPFSWHGGHGSPPILACRLGKKSGIYLWAVKCARGELVCYVGETGRKFSTRMVEHFTEHVPAGYHLYDPAEFVKGVKEMLWPGRHNPVRETTVAEFVDHLSTLAKPIEELARLYRFWLAPFDGDRRARERIEAALSEHLRSQGGIIGGFQDKGVRYRGRCDSEEAVQVLFESESRVCGLPESLLV